MKRKNIILVLFFLAVLIGLFAAGNFFLSFKKNKNMIGFSVYESMDKKWEIAKDSFSNKAAELGFSVKTTFAEDNPVEQASQIGKMVKDGAKVIVVFSGDFAEVKSAIEKARESGVKVIAYDFLIKNIDLDFCVSFDNVRAGQLQAEMALAKVSKGNFAYFGGTHGDNNTYLLKDGFLNILNPLISSNKVLLEIDRYVNTKNPEQAYEEVKSYLENERLAAIIAADDGLAAEAIAALSEKNLEKDVAVIGLGADMETVRRIINGTQVGTVYKPVKSLAEKAAEIAAVLAAGEFKNNSILNNGKMNVPAYLLEPIAIDKSNISGIIKDGIFTEQEVYQ